jgi:poly(hydroxyalkanoate) granule-associated protein
MVKKLKQMAEKQTAAAAAAPANIIENILQAGMTAVAKAQEEMGRVFEALEKEGSNLQRKTQAIAEEKLGAVTSRVTNVAGDVQAKAGQQWDKLETIFEERVAKALSKLGVPSSKEIEALNKRIDTLSAQLAKLNKAGTAPKAAATKAPAKTTRAKAVKAEAAVAEAATAVEPVVVADNVAPIKAAAKRVRKAA